MILKVYQNYIGKQFLITFIKTVFIFFTLAFILNIFEEIKYFENDNSWDLELEDFINAIKSNKKIVRCENVHFEKQLLAAAGNCFLVFIPLPLDS